MNKKKLILSSLGTFALGVLVGGALLYNDDVYSTVKETITGDDLQNNVSGLSPADIQGMDIETALMMVQSERTKLLDTQLQTQIAEVQARNEMVAKLNAVLAGLNQVQGRLGVKAELGEAVTSEEQSMLEQLYSTAGITGTPKTKVEVDVQITTLKGKIDAQGNSQKMDMLRLQSMSDKRNEAFDVMTNFVKKMQESRSSIIGNMR